jgi:hypothetical protein
LSELNCRGSKIRVVVHRQKYELRIRYLLSDSPGGVYSVQEWHGDIRDNYIRSKPDCFCQQGTTIHYHSNDGKCPFQVDAQSLAEYRVVIGDENSRMGRVWMVGLHKANRLPLPDSCSEADASV